MVKSCRYAPLVKSPNTTNTNDTAVLVVVEHRAIVEIQFPGVIIVGRELTTRPVVTAAKLTYACF